jgi:transposase
MFPKNRNDHEAFRKILNGFLSVDQEEWQLIISDTGLYSLENLTYIKFKSMLPVIHARSNIKNQPVEELKKGYYFNTDFIPSE